MTIVPTKRFFVNLELTLILGLCEGMMFDLVLGLKYTRFEKAGILMLGTAGVFTLVTRLIKPLAEGTLKTVAKADEGSQLSRLVIHLGILALLFFLYLEVFF